MYGLMRGCWVLSSIFEFWDPLLFVALFTGIFFLTLLFNKLWNRSYSKGEQEEPFISGNEEEPSMHLKAPNLYWGFFEIFKEFYSKMNEMHSNVVNDYIYWFIVVLAIALVLIGVS